MPLRVGLAQINTTVGDMRTNADSIARTISLAMASEVDLVIFPEMCICGYPPEDLLHKPKFLRDNTLAIEQAAAGTHGITAIVGMAEGSPTQCHNAAAVLENGQVKAIYRKGLLPNYGVFDEKRYFTPGQEPLIIEKNGLRIAVTICEDIWDINWLDHFLNDAKHRMGLIINLSASPFNAGKKQQRLATLAVCSRHFDCPVVYCNLVGGQDELVFDGRSMIVDSDGSVAVTAKEFCEDLCIADFQVEGEKITAIKRFDQSILPHEPLVEIDEIHQALILGTRDYVRKNGFCKAVIGLSGGIDSALVAAIAVEALGAENVIGITMPSRFNTAETRSDAHILAKNLGIEFYTVPIPEVLDAFSKTLAALDEWNENGLAYENLQARIRGTILMSYSNQFGWLVLTTGNKSETAVGYSTLYGDTAGGFAVIKDVFKTVVYKLCRRINQQAGQAVIPETIIARPPSAELRPNQKDCDSLPDYDVLDEILKNYIELNHSANELIEAGFEAETVHRVIRLVDQNEYKRRQSPPGIKITPRAFGKDRRVPITNRYKP